MADKYITPILKSGKSPIIKIRDGQGYVDFDEPPQENPAVPGKMYKVVMLNEDGTEKGVWGLQLEKKYQGGRWEKAHHARKDWERYSGMSGKEQMETMDAMWGKDTPTSNILKELLFNGASFNQMKKAVKEVDTWRQISHGEPKPKKKATVMEVK